MGFKEKINAKEKEKELCIRYNLHFPLALKCQPQQLTCKELKRLRLNWLLEAVYQFYQIRDHSRGTAPFPRSLRLLNKIQYFGWSVDVKATQDSREKKAGFSLSSFFLQSPPP